MTEESENFEILEELISAFPVQKVTKNPNSDMF